METLLEQQRRYHEERERLQDAMTKEMLQPSKGVRTLITRMILIVDTNKKLISRAYKTINGYPNKHRH